MRSVKDVNHSYNIQDVVVLSVMLEHWWQKIKVSTGFDPRCFTSASTFSGAIERVKSKIFITFPKGIETELAESLLSRGYSSVHLRLGFDNEILPLKQINIWKIKTRLWKKNGKKR